MSNNKVIKNAEDKLRKVCEQRDRAWSAIGRLIHTFWGAHYNHAFDAEDIQTEEKNGKKEVYHCSAGRTLSSVFHGCDLFDNDEVCKGYDCPMGFHHREIYGAVRDASKVIDELRAEQDPFNLERIPKYDPDKKYKVTPKWFARMCFMFLNGFHVGAKYTAEESRRHGDALASLVCICLSSLGFEFPIDFLSLSEEDKNALQEDDPRFVSFQKTFDRFHEMYDDKIKEFEDSDTEAQKKILKCNDDFVLAIIVKNMLIVMCEYAFGHEYPGADLGVYQGYFDSVKFDCGVVMGFEEDESNFSIIQNINDTSLDNIGFAEEDLK